MCKGTYNFLDNLTDLICYHVTSNSLFFPYAVNIIRTMFVPTIKITIYEGDTYFSSKLRSRVVRDDYWI